jgi:hypothetical protein
MLHGGVDRLHHRRALILCRRDRFGFLWAWGVLCWGLPFLSWLDQNDFFRHDFVLAAIVSDFEGGSGVTCGERQRTWSKC